MEIWGSVVVVTGASSGIGLATARSLAGAGAKVVLAARSIETLKAVAEELRALGREALAIATDMTDQVQVQHLIEATCDYYGHLDILINNAALGSAAFVADSPIDHFSRLFDVNVFGPLYAMQAAIKRMRQYGGGVDHQCQFRGQQSGYSRLGRLWRKQGGPGSRLEYRPQGAGNREHSCDHDLPA